MSKVKMISESPVLSDRCIVCGEVFAKKHPKDNRCICEKCCDKIARMIGVKDEKDTNGL